MQIWTVSQSIKLLKEAGKSVSSLVHVLLVCMTYATLLVEVLRKLMRESYYKLGETDDKGEAHTYNQKDPE